MAYDTLLRRSELSALQVPDLFEEMDGDATLLVRRSKSDQEGEGETVWIAPDSPALVRAWLERAASRTGRCSAADAAHQVLEQGADLDPRGCAPDPA